MACDDMQANRHQNKPYDSATLGSKTARIGQLFCTDGQRMSTPYANWWLEVSLVRQRRMKFHKKRRFSETQQFVELKKFVPRQSSNVCTNNPSFCIYFIVSIIC